MNQSLFRLVFNESANAWQAVPECARAHGKRASRVARSVVALGLLASTLPAVADPARNAMPVPRLDFVSRGSVSAPVVSGNRMLIEQQSDKAVVNWASFNIGADATVQFSQPSSTAAILNRIWDANPSQINGHLLANGQVYLINRNGILFGEGAQVNVGGLVASALNINDDLFEQGFLSNGRAGDNPAFFFDPNYDGSTAADAQAKFQAAKVVVGKGATIESVDGGRVMLLAPSVDVAGKVSTPGGQAVIAAGAKVYLAASENENLRGILVEVDPLNPNFSTGNSDGDGKVSIDEMGEVVATRGNVSIAAYAIQVDGSLRASTGATGAGTVFLQGRDMVKPKVDPSSTAYSYAYASRAGEVTIGSTGEIRIDLENAATDTLLDSVAVPVSRVSITGSKILMQDGASIKATAGTVSMIATARFDFVNGIQRLVETLPALNKTPVDVADIPASSILARGAAGNGARIVISGGASIDVSGAKGGVDAPGAQVSAARNQIDAKLLSAELKDAPLQRTGVLYRKDVSFDLRRMPDGVLPIADLSGYTALVKRSVQERSTAGGDVRLISQGDVIVDAGARIDVSGGWTRFLSADIVSTVLSANGRLFDFEVAPADIVYTGLTTRTTTIPTYDEGADAGSVEIVSRNVVLDGTLQGQAHAGLYQRQDVATAPKGGTLAIGAQIGEGDYGADDVVFAAGTLLGADFRVDPLNAALGGRAGVVSLDPGRIASSGFQTVSVMANGDIDVPTGSTWSLPALMTLDLVAVGDIAIDRAIRSAGMHLSAESTNGDVRVGTGVSIDASGLWINDALARMSGSGIWQGLLALDGGSVALSATGDVVLASGSRIDVSGGAHVDVTGAVTLGDAGAIALAHTGGRSYAGGLTLDGVLAAYAFQYGSALGAGGRLDLTADDIVIQGTGVSADSLVLSDSFFGTGGFSDYRLQANWGAVDIGDGAQITLRRQTRVLGRAFSSAGSMSAAIGATTLKQVTDALADEGRFSASATAVPEAEPGATAADRARVGRVIVGEGAHIALPAQSEIDLAAGRQLIVAGALTSAAGTVNLTLTDTVDTSSGSDVGYFADQGIFLSDSASIDVSGFSRIVTDRLGRRSGEVFDGGSIDMNAHKGYVIAQAGSTLSANGAVDRIDLANGQRMTVASSGGSVSVSTREGALIASTIAAHGGDAGARGGQFALTLNRGNVESVGVISGATRYPTDPRVLHIVDTLPDLAGWVAGGAVPAGVMQASAWVSPAQLAQGGVDVIALDSDNIVRFDGTDALNAGRSIRIDAPMVEVADGVDATITAPHVSFAYTDELDQVVRSVSAGGGMLHVGADTIDVIGNTGFSNLSQLVFQTTGDVRLSGVQPEDVRLLSGSLTASGDMAILARQLYATTNTTFELDLPGVGSALRIAGSGNVPQVPLSAGADLTLRAGLIDQGGVVRTPFGSLSLIARDQLVLRDGSLTSSSGAGATIPYGMLEGSDWVLPYADGSRDVLEHAPVQTVVLDAPVVTQEAGAVVDLSGGGELIAYEFTPGSGGSVDVLAQPGTYAIVPDFDASDAPIDPVYGAGFDLPAGTRITIGAGADLPAGNYLLLPAHYALLPGAYKITRLAGQDMLASETSTQTLGGTVIAGRLSEGSVGDDRSSRWLIESGELTRARSEYSEASADAFFSARATTLGASVPRSTQDAGHLIASATQSLMLDGVIRFDTEDDRRGGLFDVDAVRVAIGAPVGNALVLSVDSLNASGAESIVIGGRRNFDAQGAVTLDVGAEQVVLDSPDTLRAGEIVLAATDSVLVADGSRIEADPGRQVGGDAMKVVGDGALIRVASGGEDVVRTGATGAQGSVRVGENARLSGERVQVDATKDTRVAQSARIDSSVFALGADRITLGDANPALGVGLSDDLLAGLANADRLVLRSYSSIDIADSLELGSLAQPLRALTLDSAMVGWTGPAGGAATIVADAVTLTNTTGVTVDDAGGRTLAGNGGTLTIQAVGASSEAGLITVGEGVSSLRGFDGVGGVRMSAERGVRFDGAGSLSVAGDASLAAPLVTVVAGADNGLAADGALVIDALAASAGAAPLASGAGQLALSGARLTQRGAVAAASGAVSLSATAGDVVLEDGATLSAASLTREFDGTTEAFDAGRITLTAAGDVRIEQGARIDLSGTADADAGELRVHAGNGTVHIDGELVAQTGSADAQGGRFDLDAGTLASLDALVGKTADFDGGMTLRVREGDLVLGAGNTLKAGSVALSADRGDVRIEGIIDARGEAGGSVALAARRAEGVGGADGGMVRIDGQVLASARSAGEAGGSVELSVSADTAANEAGVGITLGAGSVIDVRGQDAAGASVDDGALTLVVPIVSNGAARTIGVDNAGATLRGMAQVNAEAVRTERHAGDLSLDAIWQTTVAGDLQSFHALYAQAVATRVAGTSGVAVQVRPGVEVRAEGSIHVDTALDFMAGGGTTWRYGATDETAGALSLRAGGDINVNQSISDGFASASSATVSTQADGWRYRLVAGADLAAANRLATAAGGDLNLTGSAVIRSGTGDIDIATGGQVSLPGSANAIYSAGRRVTDVPAFVIQPGGRGSVGLTPVFTTDGGDVRLVSAGDIQGAAVPLSPARWLWRQGAYRRAVVSESPAYWVEFAAVGQLIGALGGGDVSLRSGGSLIDLAVAVPQTGVATTAEGVRTYGGGRLDVAADGDILRGDYLIGAGEGYIRVGGRIANGAEGSEADGVSQLRTLLYVGDARLEVNALGDVSIQSVMDPVLLPMASANGSDRLRFASMTEDSAVSISSAAGSTTLGNPADPVIGNGLSIAAAANGLETNTVGTEWTGYRLLPASVELRAMVGDVILDSDAFDLFMTPSATGQLALLAGKDVVVGEGLQLGIRMFDMDPALLGSLANPLDRVEFGNVFTAAFGASRTSTNRRAVNLHAGDSTPARIVAVDGDVSGSFVIAKATEVSAGGDVRNLRLITQHNDPLDVTRVSAGGAVVVEELREPASNARLLSDAGIVVHGPGEVLVLAGTGLNLGAGEGIRTVGNTVHATLPEDGARIRLVVGQPQSIDMAAFVDTYLAGEGVASSREFLRNWLQGLGMSAPDGNAAIAVLQTLDTDRQLAFAQALLRQRFVETYLSGQAGTPDYRTQWADYAVARALDPDPAGASATDLDRFRYTVLWQELAASGSAAEGVKADAEANPGKYSAAELATDVLYARGFTALALAGFSDSFGVSGDARLVFSQIKAEDGGGVDILVPGGGLDVGLVNQPEGFSKEASELGIVATRGDVNVMVHDSIAVNQSRVFALDGGDILMWASTGDVGAGSGERTALSAPPPILTIDRETGAVKLVYQGATSGSGIATIFTDASISSGGNVRLYAPAGIIDAGEAGIQSSGNLELGAIAIQGGDLIVSAGSSNVAAAPAAPQVASVSNPASDAASAAEQLLESDPPGAGNMRSSLLTVEVLAVGEECDDQRRDTEKCRRRGG